MMRHWGLAALALALAGSTAAADGSCVNCYRQVAHPPVTETLKEEVVVTAERTATAFTAPDHVINTEPVVQRRAHAAPYWVPSAYGTVDERVMLAPAGKAWRTTVDAQGRKVACYCDGPATWGVRRRHVLVEPAHVAYETIPAVVEYVPTFRTARIGVVSHYTVPAVYGVRERQVVVRPGYSEWQPAGRAY